MSLIEINHLLAPVNHTAPSATKYRLLEEYLSEQISPDAGKIYTSYVNKAGNMTVRMTQSPRAREADLLIALVPYQHQYEASVDTARSVVRDTGQPMLIMMRHEEEELPWRPMIMLTGPEGHESKKLIAELRKACQAPDYASSNFKAEPVSDAAAHTFRTAALFTDPGDPEPPSPQFVPTLKIDDRTRRMLRNAIASHKAVMLVGPPGTGKSSLVWEIIRELREDPSAFGMTMDHELMTVTADESWTTRELVGGESVDKDGAISFEPGYVLQAIQKDKWLLIDEANRADMDRIFGGLLTWLTGDSTDSVTLGRAAPGIPAEIRLGWTDAARSEVGTEDTAEDEKDEEERFTEYRAGREWRLIGTYNSLDAQRVFRFGLALGRRFAQIPVAPPRPELFREIFEERTAGLKISEDYVPEITERIERIYNIHYSRPETAMGPALFLALPKSVEAGLQNSDAQILPLLAEAYLLCFGPWLARLDDPILAELGEQISGTDALSTEWDWVNQQLQHIR
ncbi:AAA family ATPase [Streptomyces sp. NPDC053427]|uniref:AAA family ATPase n=1 Tax=Streptomyces sp. NPDC053427 TaxID=3365701 RepID=UPI0037D0732A